MTDARRTLGMVSLISLLAVMLGAPKAWGGATHIYFQAGQGEAPYSTPCVTTLIPGSTGNMQPITVQRCTSVTADNVYFHFIMPADYPAAGPGIVMTVYGMGNGANVGTARFTGTISVNRPGGANWRSTTLSGFNPASSAEIPDSGSGYMTSRSTSTIPAYDMVSSGMCGGGVSCAGGLAVLRVQRTNVGGGDTGGAFDIVAIDLEYAN
jgi:hypothetical protein